MPPEAQSDLIDLMQCGDRPVRVMGTSTRPLASLAASEEFSRAVACALSTITIELVPLCDRPEDLPILAQAFIEEANLGSSKQIGGMTPGALDQLAAYSWPGNVDELGTLVRQAHERATGGEITSAHLPKQIQWAAEAGAHPRRADESIVLEEYLARVERELIVRAMRRAKNNKSRAAKLLGLTRPRLYRRLVQLGLEPPDTTPP
jgi:DNA-binding NtrC family response regulator